MWNQEIYNMCGVEYYCVWCKISRQEEVKIDKSYII